MARTSGRIVLSKNPGERLDLFQKIYDKHLSLGAASLLLMLEDVDWSVVGPQIGVALQAHVEAEELKRQMEEKYRERDVLMPPLNGALLKSLKLLKASMGDNPKKLGEWFVNVDDSKQKK